MRQTAHLILILLLGSLSACRFQVPLQGDSAVSPQPTTPSPTPEDPTANPTQTQRPEVSSETIQVEGTPVQLSLTLLNEPELPFTTYVPTRDFVTDIVESDTDTSIVFYSNLGGTVNESAYVRIVLPKRSTTYADVRNRILGDRGLLTQNRWQITDRTNVVVYPWAQEQIMFRSAAVDETTVGKIFMGEHNGRGFYVLMHYPVEYTEGFDPRAMVILDELKFRE